MFSLRGRNPQLVVIVVGVALITLNVGTGFIDRLSTDYLQEAMMGSGAIYGTARAINALVSLLQGTEVNAWVATFAVGELLDPVNDLIERFSGVITIVMASLALQALLLGVFSGLWIDVSLVALGGLAFWAHQKGSPEWAFKTLRIFFISLMVRLSMVVVAVAGHGVDQIFLNETVNNMHVKMKEFRTELEIISGQEQKDPGLKDQIKQLENMVLEKEKNITIWEGRLIDSQNLIELFKKDLQESDSRTWLDKLLSNPSPPAAIEAQHRIDLERAKQSDYEVALERVREELEVIADELGCIKKKELEQSCSFFPKLFSDDENKPSMTERIEHLSQDINAFALNTVNLLATMLLKSILLPILFLAVFFKLPRFFQWLLNK
jgi:hypothetical protein